jgi:hypothetical protein
VAGAQRLESGIERTHLRSDHRDRLLEGDGQEVEIGDLGNRVARQANTADPACADVEAVDRDAGVELDPAGLQMGDPRIDPHLAGRSAHGAVVGHSR